MDWARVRTWAGHWNISAEPVLTPLSGGWFMQESPVSAFGTLLALLGLTKNEQGTTPASSYVSDDSSPEEVIVYADDNLDVIIRNYGQVHLEDDLPADAVFALGGLVESFLFDPYGEVDRGWGNSSNSSNARISR